MKKKKKKKTHNDPNLACFSLRINSESRSDCIPVHTDIKEAFTLTHFKHVMDDYKNLKRNKSLK